MKPALYERLLNARNQIVHRDAAGVRSYDLARFDQTYMQPMNVPGTPFRLFETVPQAKHSKRQQNNSNHFDPYVDTLFDYPLVVRSITGRSEPSIPSFNYHLTIHVPYCGMSCWHCYNCVNTTCTLDEAADRSNQCRSTCAETSKKTDKWTFPTF